MNFLLFLKKQPEVMNAPLLAISTNTPYARNLPSVLVNIGVIKYIANSKYKMADVVITTELVDMIVAKLKEITNKAKYNMETPNTIKLEPIPTPVPVTIVTNPFGFADFDYIMVEKGSIVIGQYTLTGSFTLTKNPVKKDLSL
jgi:hypothetical protein